ncbi:hypothetical protein [uncultured Polaribacter sp.]|uniref:hypothetical protein n=1 Tax=uncultured Polaribacter sp. TaxID=174711 RepID=UPI002607354F|nr:hypothetical protein [uncultured Polaribacter sp.]
MKNLCLLVAFFVTIILPAQSTYTVDNKPNAKADFSNLQTAINTVTTGSILLVQGSSTSYGGITIEKKITIKGTGYFLGENPNTQKDFSESKVSSISLKAGSSGSTISGLYATSWFKIFDGVSNISFIRNRVLYISHSGAASTNNLVKENYIIGYSQSNCSSCIRVAIALNDSEITGNYIGNSNFIQGTNLNIINNVLQQSIAVAPSSNFYCNANVKDSFIQNNIMNSAAAIPTNYNSSAVNNCGNSLRNNIFYHPSNTSQETDNFNNKLVIKSPFVDNSDNQYSTDGKYILSSDSPAKGAGVGGVDCGMFAGGYKLSGIPDIPNIYEFNVPITGYSNSTGIQVNVKVKSNN